MRWRSGLLAVALAGCYSPQLPPCAVHCGSDSPCPADTSCGADQFCHEAGDSEMCTLPATSCVGLAATCGATGDGSCCESPLVTGGTYDRGDDMAADMLYTDLTRPATVSTFRLDKYEVTVGRFRQFVAAGQGTQASPPSPGAGARRLNGAPDQAGWDATWNQSLVADTSALVAALACDPGYATWTDSPAGNENRPIVCVDWYEAMAFCAWDGGFLPTDAEWGYAASGGGQQRAYPWSSPAGSTVIDCSLTNYGGSNWGATACVVAGAANVGSVSPQGDGVWGQSDLGGNVWEVVLDWYVMPPPAPCVDCANLFAATERTRRGGSYSNTAELVRVAGRGGLPPLTRYQDIGLRCARAP